MKASWVIFLDRSSDKILLVKRSHLVNNPGKWNFPGGSAKRKKPKKLAKHEAIEEVGIKTNKVRLILKVPTKHKKHFFYVVYLSGKVDVKLNFESSKYKWCKVEKLIEQNKKHKSLKLFLRNFQHVKNKKIKTKTAVRPG